MRRARALCVRVCVCCCSFVVACRRRSARSSRSRHMLRLRWLPLPLLLSFFLSLSPTAAAAAAALSHLSLEKRSMVGVVASLRTCRRTRWTREEHKEWEGGSAGWWGVYSWLEERGEMETAKIKLMKAKDKQQSTVQINK